MPPWVPNALTVLRIALVPAFLVHAHWCAESVAAGGSDAPHRFLSAAAFLAIGASDVADGWIARRWDLTTQLGAALDAIADKFALVCALAFFALSRGEAFAHVPLWLVALVVGRDALLFVGMTLVKRRHGRVDASHELHGKVTSLLLFALVLWVTLDLPRGVVLPASVVLGALTVLSAAGYVRAGLRQW